MLQETEGVTQNDSLFSFNRKGKVHTLTADIFVQNVQQILRHVGLNAQIYSVHSFRKGGATFANSCGISDEELKA